MLKLDDFRSVPILLLWSFPLLKIFVSLFLNTDFPSAESLQFFAQNGFRITFHQTVISGVFDCLKDKALRYENVIAEALCDLPNAPEGSFW